MIAVTEFGNRKSTGMSLFDVWDQEELPSSSRIINPKESELSQDQEDVGKMNRPLVAYFEGGSDEHVDDDRDIIME
jgi:hypothetical protein